jgi:hypothetical protein
MGPYRLDQYHNANTKDEQREARLESHGMAKDWHRPEPTKHKNNDECDAIEQRRPPNDSGVVCECGHTGRHVQPGIYGTLIPLTNLAGFFILSLVRHCLIPHPTI